VIVSFTLFVFYQCVGQAHKVHETITFLLVTLPNIYRLKNYLTNWAINLNLVFKNSPHLKYVATLPCNMSLRVCFADINVSQGSVATYARCGKISTHLTVSLPVKTFKSVETWQKYGQQSVAPLFSPTLCTQKCMTEHRQQDMTTRGITETDTPGGSTSVLHITVILLRYVIYFRFCE